MITLVLSRAPIVKFLFTTDTFPEAVMLRTSVISPALLTMNVKLFSGPALSPPSPVTQPSAVILLTASMLFPEEISPSA